ncbi:hypothetical protein CJP74_07125 [Psittacicella melopsittaci]|uniref:Transposase InsH N-terminal domain-containing protein n=1 Tax=Psittacicella melopsittaci TaxID=2028576 RepID=A0A3A1Y2J2_9GAMM|nr:transposase [Psittacicella melopsittaci]RIY31526.1 hypothetical protein CJP74_07125 [Psittacicella melopsittaci]
MYKEHIPVSDLDLPESLSASSPLVVAKKYLDFSFIRPLTTSVYTHKMGRPNIDPVLICKVVFLSLLENKSFRKVTRELDYNPEYAWFLDITLQEKFLNHSSLSRHLLRLKKAQLLVPTLTNLENQARELNIIDPETDFLRLISIKDFA